MIYFSYRTIKFIKFQFYVQPRPMSVQYNLITTFFKSKPQGNTIIALLLVEAILVVQDLFNAIPAISKYQIVVAIVGIDIVICVLLYMIIKTPNRMKFLHPDPQSILVASLKEIARLSFLIFVLEIVWFLIIIFILNFSPGFLNTVSLFTPLIIGLVARSSSANAINNPNFMFELEQAANPPAPIHLSSHRAYQPERYSPIHPHNQAPTRSPVQPQYDTEIPTSTGIDTCPDCFISKQSGHYCENCGTKLHDIT